MSRVAKGEHTATERAREPLWRLAASPMLSFSGELAGDEGRWAGPLPSSFLSPSRVSLVE